jgi:hypothetical protein
MYEVTIALHAPVAAKTMEHWVEERVAGLRDAAWGSGVRLGDLSPTWQAQDADWLIEVDLRDRAVALEDDLVLGSILMEMALLGLRPQLLLSRQRESSGPGHVPAPTAQAPARRGSE